MTVLAVTGALCWLSWFVFLAWFGVGYLRARAAQRHLDAIVKHNALRVVRGDYKPLKVNPLHGRAS